MATTGLVRISWFTTERLMLAGLLLLTLVVRGGVLWAMGANLDRDPDAYKRIAENLAAHGVFSVGIPYDQFPVPTAYRPPLYPVVLSNLMVPGHPISRISVAILHLVLGVATVWFTWLTARRLFASAIVAGLLVACDPLLVYWQTYVMTETLAAFLAILSLWCLARFDAARSWFNAGLAGGAIGLAVLCRPTFLPWLGMVGAVMIVVRGGISEFRIQKAEFRRRRSWWSDFGWRVANLAGLVIAAAFVVSPWVVRNYQIFGKPIVTTTHGGYTLYLANNEDFYNYLANGNAELPWQASALKPTVLSKDEPLTEAILNRIVVLQTAAQAFEKEKLNRGYTDHIELLADRVSYSFAKRWMLDHPTECVRACLYRIRQLWSPLPHKLTADESLGRRLLRYGTCVWYLGVYALSAVGVWRLRWKFLQQPWIWGVLLCVAFTAVHTFYWTNMRMRAPLMPFIALVAAAGATNRFIPTAWLPRPA